MTWTVPCPNSSFSLHIVLNDKIAYINAKDSLKQSYHILEEWCFNGLDHLELKNTIKGISWLYWLVLASVPQYCLSFSSLDDYNLYILYYTKLDWHSLLYILSCFMILSCHAHSFFFFPFFFSIIGLRCGTIYCLKFKIWKL